MRRSCVLSPPYAPRSTSIGSAREARLTAEPRLESLCVMTVRKTRRGDGEHEDPREKAGERRDRRAARDRAD